MWEKSWESFKRKILSPPSKIIFSPQFVLKTAKEKIVLLCCCNSFYLHLFPPTRERDFNVSPWETEVCRCVGNFRSIENGHLELCKLKRSWLETEKPRSEPSSDKWTPNALEHVCNSLASITFRGASFFKTLHVQP